MSLMYFANNSQHEKMCVIDETIGFMGGLDLCFGRCVPRLLCSASQLDSLVYFHQQMGHSRTRSHRRRTQRRMRPRGEKLGRSTHS